MTVASAGVNNRGMTRNNARVGSFRLPVAPRSELMRQTLQCLGSTAVDSRTLACRLKHAGHADVVGHLKVIVPRLVHAGLVTRTADSLIRTGRGEVYLRVVEVGMTFGQARVLVLLGRAPQRARELGDRLPEVHRVVIFRHLKALMDDELVERWGTGQYRVTPLGEFSQPAAWQLIEFMAV